QVGESWLITYTYTGTISNVKFQYSVNGNPYQDIPGGTASAIGSWTWAPIPDAISSNVKVKVLDNDPGHPAAEEGISGQCLIKGKLTLDYPKGNEPSLPWNIGQTVPITWTAQGSIANIKIEYSINGGQSYPYVITPSVTSGAGTYVYYWLIPDDVQTSANVRVRVTSLADDTVKSESTFSFAIKGYLQITAPNGGVKTVGDPLTIQWNKNTGLSTVGLQFSKNGTFSDAENIPFGSPISFTAGSGTSGSYNWNTPDRISGDARIKVYDWNDPTVSSISNPFRIRGNLTLVQPNGWEEWVVGDTKVISWTMVGSISQVNLYYSKDNFVTTKTIATSINGVLLKYDWPVTDDISSTFNVKVRITDASYEIGTQDTSDNPFKIKGRIILNNPVGGEEWMVGTVQSITWTVTGSIPNVELRYSTDGGGTYPNVISASVVSGAGTKVYNWTIPSISSNSTVRVKVSDVNDPNTVYAESPNFKIRGNIVVTSPQNNDVMLVGTNFPITWTWVGIIPTVNIYYSNDAAHVVWNPIITSTANTGGFSWNVLDKISPTVKIKVVNSSDSTVEGVSTGEARIRGRFQIEYPNGGQILISGTPMPITWTWAGTMDFVKLEYTKVGNFSDALPPIAASTPNDGSYTWTIEPMISDQVKIRVSSTADPGAKDESDANFKVKGDLRVTYPNASGIEVVAGKVITITWDTIGPIQNVELRYSTDGATYPNVITPSTPAGVGAGSYTWTLPTNVAETLIPKIKIKVTDTNDSTVYDESDNSFRIKGEITLNTPNGGEEWIVYTNQVISWTTVGQVPNVKLEYSVDNFQTVTNTWTVAGAGTLPNNSNGTTFFSWPVQEPISVMMRVRVTSVVDGVVTDKSELAFKTKGSFTVLQPDGSVPWKVQENKTLQWSTNGTINQINILFSKLGDWTDSEIIYWGATNNNQAAWTVWDRIMSVAASKIRVESSTDPYPGTYKDSNPFKIRGTITMVKPDGDIWIVGENRTISWTNIGTLPNVRISFSKLGNFSDEEWLNSGNPIANANPSSGGSYQWTPVWDRIASGCRIRVYDANDSTVYGESNIFKIRGDFNITSPAGGEPWKVYDAVYQPTTYPITWTTTGTINNVKIEYSKDNFGSDINLITNTANTGIYYWRAPNDITQTNQVSIRITDSNDNTVYKISNYFKIRGDFVVNSPAAGVSWTVDSNQAVTWTTVGTIPNVKLEYSKLGDFSDAVTIIPALSNTNTYTWKIPNAVTNSPTVKVRVSDTRDSVGNNVSAGFKIRGNLLVNTPAGGEAWMVYNAIDQTQTYPITWTSTGSFTPVEIRYSLDNGATWPDTQIISASYANISGTNTYNWSVPDKITYSNSVRIRIAYVNDINYPNEVNAFSNGFKIRGKFIVNSPNGNEVWLAGDTKNITWTNVGTMDSVKLYYYLISSPGTLYPITTISN
ncbi:MAG: hypothetical protein AAB019_00130, partial [Planctomycetota bacterium]